MKIKDTLWIKIIIGNYIKSQFEAFKNLLTLTLQGLKKEKRQPILEKNIGALYFK